MTGPEVAQLGRREQDNLGGGETLPQSEQGRGGHHGIPQPIDAADQDAPWRPGGGEFRWVQRFQASSSSAIAP